MSLPNTQQSNEQILNDIQSLQSMEQELFNSLETNANLSSDQKKQIINKINDISKMRINLYQTLSNVNGFFQGALNSSMGTLQEQSAAIGIVESELNQAKVRLQALEVEKNNKIRLVEINNYYGEKYTEHARLMKIIIFTLIPIIILTVLNNKGLIPGSLFNGLLSLIAIIGGYFFWITMASIIMRDNMNYNEYNWYFYSASAPTGSTSSDDPWASNSNFGTCIGSACCSSNQTYDTSLNICVDGSNNSSGFTTLYGSPLFSNTESFSNNSRPNIKKTAELTEGMINSVLTKNSGKYKSDYIIDGNSKIKPYGGQSFVNYR